jgi:hypothetical protein
MRVYVDTGTLIDYLAQAAPVASILRSARRRGRTALKLYEDARDTLDLIATGHQGATSALTFYEVEEALFKQLAANARGLAHAASIRVSAARPIVAQALTAARLFSIQILEIRELTVTSWPPIRFFWLILSALPMGSRSSARSSLMRMFCWRPMPIFSLWTD